jgi:hypothetical protein
MIFLPRRCHVSPRFTWINLFFGLFLLTLNSFPWIKTCFYEEILLFLRVHICFDIAISVIYYQFLALQCAEEACENVVFTTF